MTFFTSDQHLGHRNIIRLCSRPLASIEEMDETSFRIKGGSVDETAI